MPDGGIRHIVEFLGIYSAVVPREGLPDLVVHLGVRGVLTDEHSPGHAPGKYRGQDAGHPHHGRSPGSRPTQASLDLIDQALERRIFVVWHHMGSFRLEPWGRPWRWRRLGPWGDPDAVPGGGHAPRVPAVDSLRLSAGRGAGGVPCGHGELDAEAVARQAV